MSAQRRPERQPRLHWPPVDIFCHQPERSTKAGASTPATRRTSRRCGSLSRPLNEGRSVNPGYTHHRPSRLPRGAIRSTKAGASTPATRGTPTSASTAFKAAQRRPERQPRLHIASSGLARSGIRPLNEGRSVNPGYTRRRGAWDPTWQTRSTKAGASTPATPNAAPPPRSSRPSRSTKAGASTPATLLNSAKGQYRDKPSLVHGCGSLDNDAFASISRDFGRYPVRMVRIKQSRLP